MASIIQNFSLTEILQKRPAEPELPPQPFQFIENLLNSSPFEKYQKICRRFNNDHTVKASIYMESTGSMEAVAEVMFDVKLSRMSMQMRVLRFGQLLRMKGRGKVNIFCRILQKYNVHLEKHNIALFVDVANATIVLRNPLFVQGPGITGDAFKELHDIASKNVQVIKDQVIYLLECANQNFEWQIYLRDARYLEKVQMEMMETMRIRELIALSHISFQEETDPQNKYAKTKELIEFLSHRENMVNPTLRKKGFLGQQMNLYCLFLEPFYFANSNLPLAKLQSDFTKQFDFLFYKFQAKKLADGDNPYLFNTILIKNEDKIQLTDTSCEGGFSKIKYAQMEIAYKESQNLVLDMPKLNSRSLKKFEDALDGYERPPKEKVIYFTKTIAVKLSKSQDDYQKVRHQKIIVQNFRTTTSPFILKYYNCTQRGFKYRQFLLMDYLGPTLTLAEHTSLHPVIFSHQSKMHIFIHLANALLFLEKQMVVHMDLSSHNIMVCRQLLIKLIDFGEAYHPYLDTDKTTTYLPGHTMPYCPPETFNQLKKFTPKSDVFSLGIILYRTLFGQFPYLPTLELKERYITKTYLERWMIAPERLSEHGYEMQLTLLLQLITRCLSVDPTKRPNPYWLYVILNKIFLSFK